MTRTAYQAPKILSPDGFVSDQVLVVENGLVAGFEKADQLSSDTELLTFKDGFLIPGFMDLQNNGGGGVLFNDAPTVETIRTIADAHRRFGTTSFLPTLISDDLEKIRLAIAAVDQAITEGVPGVVGIHLEGPFLNKVKKGIHDSDKFRTLTDEDIALLSSLKQGKTLVTLAPESADLQLIGALVEAGVRVSAGHTNATYEQTMAAIVAGLSGFTHLFNAMTPMESRAPGAVGAAFDTDDTWVGLIADGFHVHPATLRQAIKLKGIHRSMLVTDAMPTVGSQEKEFWLGGEHIIAKDGKCTNKEGVLAGSDLDMAAAVKYAVDEVGVTFREAITMATLTPAEYMGLDKDYGSLAVGKKADFLLMDEDYQIRKVWINGQHMNVQEHKS